MCLPTNGSADFQTVVFLPLWPRGMHVRVLSHTDKISDSVLSLRWLFYLGRTGLRVVYLWSSYIFGG